MTAMSERETPFTRATFILRRWRRSIRRLPLGARREDRDALWELVSWYEAMCLDGRFANPAPKAGLEAFVLMGRERTPLGPHHDVIVARRALRVAEELANYRRCLRDGADVPAVDIAANRLELAIFQVPTIPAMGIPSPHDTG